MIVCNIAIGFLDGSKRLTRLNPPTTKITSLSRHAFFQRVVQTRILELERVMIRAHALMTGRAIHANYVGEGDFTPAVATGGQCGVPFENGQLDF